MHCPWSFAHGTDLTALYNVYTGASIVLDQTFGLHFRFTSGRSMKCKRINWNVDAVIDSFQCPNLLSSLQAGQGTKIDSSTRIDGSEWRSEKEGPIIALVCKTTPSDRLYLTVDGFIFSTASNGAAIITLCSEIYTSFDSARQALDIAIAEAKKTNSKQRVDALKVSMPYS
jgi:hypothetical protein